MGLASRFVFTYLIRVNIVPIRRHFRLFSHLAPFQPVRDVCDQKSWEWALWRASLAFVPTSSHRCRSDSQEIGVIFAKLASEGFAGEGQQGANS